MRLFDILVLVTLTVIPGSQYFFFPTLFLF